MTEELHVNLNTFLALASAGAAIFAWFKGAFRAGEQVQRLEGRFSNLEAVNKEQDRQLQEFKAEYDRLNESGSQATRTLEVRLTAVEKQMDSMAVKIDSILNSQSQMAVDIAVLSRRGGNNA